MDWQQKAAALEALCEISIRCRGAGDWYVEQEVNIKTDHCMVGEFGNGETPQEAIEDHWARLVENTEGTSRYLVARPYPDQRRAVRWNGFMWADVAEPPKEAAA